MKFVCLFVVLRVVMIAANPSTSLFVFSEVVGIATKFRLHESRVIAKARY